MTVVALIRGRIVRVDGGFAPLLVEAVIAGGAFGRQ
jgi:hypothetical protein